MPAEILREPKPAEGPVPTGAPASDLDALDASTAEAIRRLNEGQAAFEERLRGAETEWERAQKEGRGAVERAQERLAPLKARAEALEGQAPGAPPAPPTEPAIPRRVIRPFGEGLPGENGMQVAQRTLMTLGLMAQMMFGVTKGYSRGALAAYSGALKGWAEGDAARAERDWQQYLANVERMQREWQRLRQQWGDQMQRYGAQKDLVGTLMAVAAAEHGADKDLVDLARRDAEQALKVLDLQGQHLRQTIMDTSTLDQRRMIARHQAKQDEIRLQVEARREAEAQRRHDEAMKRLEQTERRLGLAEEFGRENVALRREALDLRRETATKKLRDKQSSLAVMHDVLDKLDTHITALAAKGFLPSGAGRIAHERARAVRFMNPNDDDLQMFQKLQGSLVGFDRNVFDDKGRALAMYQAVLGFFDNPPTASAAHGVVGQFRDLLKRFEGAEMSATPRAVDVAPANDPLGLR